MNQPLNKFFTVFLLNTLYQNRSAKDRYGTMKKIRPTFSAVLILLCLIFSTNHSFAQTQKSKPRIIATTDGEIDDDIH